MIMLRCSYHLNLKIVMTPDKNQQPSPNNPNIVPAQSDSESSTPREVEVTTAPSQAESISNFKNHTNITPIHSDIKPSDIHLPVTPPVQPQTDAVSPQAASSTSSFPISTDNPGKATGILSIVFMFVFPILGVIFGMVSRSKSNAAGVSTKLGSIGFIGSIITTLLSITSIVLFIIFAINAGNLLKSQGSNYSNGSGSNESMPWQEKKLVSDANKLSKLAEAYHATNGDYPKTLRDFVTYPESKIPDDIKLSGNIVTGGGVAYGYCSAGAAQIAYRSWAGEGSNGRIFSGKVIITALGSASSSQACSSLNVDYHP
ncbi:MAG: DUF4190 domain-containing protein [Candidatus Saccharibacteria bacterium]|nr:DUF4190 domain-containing protein [Candidatus Saccharibacteria bacterium]